MKAIMQLRLSCALCLCFVLLSGCDYFRSVPARIARAEQMLADSKYREAAIELKGVIDNEPKNAQARLLLARIYLHQFELGSAQRELELARANGASAAVANPLEIDLLLAQGRYEQVLAKLADPAFALGAPGHALRQARAYLGLQRFAEALAQYNGVLTSAAPLPKQSELEARLGRAEARASLGSLDESLAELQTLVQSDATNAQAWALLGLMQARSGATEQAIVSLANADRHAVKLLSVKQHAEVLSMAIELHLGNRNIASAEQSLHALNKIMPGSLIARLLQARILIAKQDFPGAAAELQHIVRAAPDVASAQFLLGMVLLQQGNINQAEQHLARAVALAPQHLEARKLLAQAQLRLDRPQAAIQSLQPALDSPGLDLQVHGLLGLAEKQAGTESSSIEYLLQAVAEQPEDSNRRLELAAAYLRTAKYDDAIAQLRRIEEPTLQAPRAAMMAMAVVRTQGIGNARSELEAQLARYPKDAALLGVVADFYAQTGQMQRGLALLTKAIQIAPQDTGMLISRARLLAATNDMAGAERDLKAALALKSNDRAALLGLADLSQKRGDLSSAMRWLEQLGHASPDDVQVELLKARVLLGAKQAAASQQASDILTRLVKAQPERSDVRMAVARLYVGAGRYEEALTQLRAASAIAKQDPAIQLEIARTQVALSQFGDARNTVAEILQRQPTWLPGVALAAWLDVERHANDAAIARMAALRKLQPNDPQVCAAQGEILMVAGRPDLAVEPFEKALTEQPTAQFAIKAYVARKSARQANATAPLERYVAERPLDLAARGALAQAYHEAGDLKHAVEQYEKMQAGPPSAVLLNNLAWLYSELGDPRAVATAEAALALAPRSPAVADTLGWVLVKQGKYAEALPILKAAAADAPNIPEIRYHYAVALVRTGARDEARAALNEALRQTSDFPSRGLAEELRKELPDGAAAAPATR